MYGEAKLALVLYLWHPKTRGATHVYDSYLQPLLATHEADIDRGLLELRAWAKDAMASHLQAAVAFGRACFVQVAGRVSSQLQPAGSARRRPHREGTVTLTLTRPLNVTITIHMHAATDSGFPRRELNG
ncbi:hypothetical protein ABZP36_035305 [Zizania latifolia]